MNEFSTLVVGGGISGIQAALDLADQGYKVLLIDHEPSIGGKMIQLSKVFPTLDCASCITTPKISAVAHHPNITIWTYSELERLDKQGDGTFNVIICRKARFVDEKKCIGCRQCEFICPSDVPSEFEMGIGARKAIYIPFQTAFPQIALLDKENCTACGRCERICPADAVDYAQEDKIERLTFNAVVMTTGYRLLPIEDREEWGKAQYLNVISSLTMERLLAPNGPYGGVRRPSDGKLPFSVAFVLCAGSRDRNLGVPYCSRICCMYSIKQAILLSGAIPVVDITIYYIDIRAYGKGFEQFYQNAKAMGINFIKGKVAEIIEDPETHDPIVRVEHIEEDAKVHKNKHDLVVLALGAIPSWTPQKVCSIKTGEDKFIESIKLKENPTLTSEIGIFAGGTVLGPKDIVDSIIEGSAAAMHTSIHLKNFSKTNGS